MTNTTLLFDGTDLSSLTGIIVTDLSQLIPPYTRRGGHDPLAGQDGWLGAELPLDGFNFSVGMVVAGETEAEMWTHLDGLAVKLRGTNGLGALEWRRDNGTGGYNARTAAGACAGLNPTLLNLETGQLNVSFANLDGAWWTGTEWI